MGKNKYMTALNGRLLSRRPRIFQSCSAIEEEEEVLLLLLLLLTAFELSLGGSSPYTSTNKTINNKYT